MYLMECIVPTVSTTQSVILVLPSVYLTTYLVQEGALWASCLPEEEFSKICKFKWCKKWSLVKGTSDYWREH